MPLGNTQQGLGGTARLAAALLPVLQGPRRHPQEGGEAGLGQARHDPHPRHRGFHGLASACDYGDATHPAGLHVGSGFEQFGIQISPVIPGQ